MTPILVRISGLILLLITSAWASTAQQIVLIRAFPQLTFDNPVALTHAGDGSDMLYVVEQTGTIRSFSNSDVATESDLFLDIEAAVVSGGERGLLGLAFHPAFETNGRFFVYYSASTGDGPVTRLSRFERSGGPGSAADPESQAVLFEVSQTASNHNGGDLAFGPDGMLYVTIGDGGKNASDAQDRSNLLGTIVRIDVDDDGGEPPYGIPDDNPFVGNETGIREEIYAWGLRNPWRFSIDGESGVIWAGDVGQNDWEEINVIVSGGNYGWPVMEGLACYQSPGCDKSPYVLPVHTYQNGVAGRSITGGHVYRGSLAPDLVGAYMFGDFLSGRIWRLDNTGSDYAATELDLGPNLLVSAFGEDEDQELYVLDYGGGGVYRFEAALVESTEGPADRLSRTHFGLAGPNPFAGRTSLEIVVPQRTPVLVDIFDMLGRRVGPAFQTEALPGVTINLVVGADDADMGPGVFVARLTTEWGVKSVLLTRIR